MDRFNHLYAFNGFDKQNEEVQNLKKQLREDKAKFVKQKAILEQQVELLTYELHDASEREKSIKKTYTTMMAALQIRKKCSDTFLNYSPTMEQGIHKQDSGNSDSPKSPSPFRGSTSQVKQKNFIIKPQKSKDSA